MGKLSSKADVLLAHESGSSWSRMGTGSTRSASTTITTQVMSNANVPRLFFAGITHHSS